MSELTKEMFDVYIEQRLYSEITDTMKFYRFFYGEIKESNDFNKFQIYYEKIMRNVWKFIYDESIFKSCDNPITEKTCDNPITKQFYEDH